MLPIAIWSYHSQVVEISNPYFSSCWVPLKQMPLEMQACIIVTPSCTNCIATDVQHDSLLAEIQHVWAVAKSFSCHFIDCQCLSTNHKYNLWKHVRYNQMDSTRVLIIHYFKLDYVSTPCESKCKTNKRSLQWKRF